MINDIHHFSKGSVLSGGVICPHSGLHRAGDGSSFIISTVPESFSLIAHLVKAR